MVCIVPHEILHCLVTLINKFGCMLLYVIAVVTGASDGIGKEYALQASLGCIYYAKQKYLGCNKVLGQSEAADKCDQML